jgi:hypothetical protein
MADENTAPVEQTTAPELSNKEKLEQINQSLGNLRATEAACSEILKNKKIKIIDLADTSEDPLSLTLNGNAVVSVIRPIVQGVEQSRTQLVALKEQLLDLIEKEITK